MPRLTLVPIFAVLSLACAKPTPINPAFDVSECEAKAALREMGRFPKPLTRPVIVVGGWLDPTFSTSYPVRM